MRKTVLVWLGVIFCLSLKAQIEDTLYETRMMTGWFNVSLFYENGSLAAVKDSFGVSLDFANTCIRNPVNQRVFVTDGLRVLNDKVEIALNSECLVDSISCNVFRRGASTIQGLIFIPSKFQKAWLIYQSGDGVTSNEVRRLYWAELDMAYNNGQGKITKSKQMLLDGPIMNPSEMTQVRHANGRDWWVVQPGADGLIYHVFLVTPDTIVLDHVQTIGDSVVGGLWGMARFSPQGDKYCITAVNSMPQLFDFDRCSGYFSNPVRICTMEPEEDVFGNIACNCCGRLGCIFSPNGRFLYLNSYSDIRQYDLQSGRPLNVSYQVIAKYDSTYTTTGPSFTFFYGMQALDNKLYYCTWTADASGYHVIHSPDSLGKACRFENEGLRVPGSRVYWPLPNIPFYRLGKLEGSSCDTIVGIKETAFGNSSIQLLPNPGRKVRLEWKEPHPIAASFAMMDLQGRPVFREAITDAETQLDFETLPAGLYFWEVRDRQGALLQSGKQVLQP